MIGVERSKICHLPINNCVAVLSMMVVLTLQMSTPRLTGLVVFTVGMVAVAIAQHLLPTQVYSFYIETRRIFLRNFFFELLEKQSD